jgi:hypothetical protein
LKLKNNKILSQYDVDCGNCYGFILFNRDKMKKLTVINHISYYDNQIKVVENFYKTKYNKTI